MEHNQELKSFINIWCIAISSICYCYFIPARISGGVARLLSLVPVVTVFSILPPPFSTVHLAFLTFFFLVWLGNFKLLLFAFNRGPLSSKPRLPIHTFVSVALLPINPKQSNNNSIIIEPFPFPLPKPILLAIKVAIITMCVHVYPYKDNLQWSLIIFLSFLYMYITFELGFATIAFFVKIFHGFDLEIEPQFNEPYLATSLQDFWGRRWNIVSSSILRATIYNPIRMMLAPHIGKFRGQLVGIFVTFVVSGLMHEWMFFYLLRVRPTWEVTWFFVLNGVSTAVEVAVKKAVNDRFHLHRAVSGPLTMSFLVVTGGWLLFGPLITNGVDARFINESLVVLNLIGIDVNIMQ
ncbi:hypothetical protein QVD17_38586 [Tagetes erecta]|uniref:Wax synthase domain-containing protein n=1 Tax=Tagetes erecta TaxID=13708 RepID=A0AAD8JQR9_TARER|nr:hypothetical protein QVD17_38586 [Tagetes erecta]